MINIVEIAKYKQKIEAIKELKRLCLLASSLYIVILAVYIVFIKNSISVEIRSNLYKRLTESKAVKDELQLEDFSGFENGYEIFGKYAFVFGEEKEVHLVHGRFFYNNNPHKFSAKQGSCNGDDCVFPFGVDVDGKILKYHSGKIFFNLQNYSCRSDEGVFGVYEKVDFLPMNLNVRKINRFFIYEKTQQ